MPLTPEQRQGLLRALEARGWVYREGLIYAPNQTLWLYATEPWQEDLTDFHERMVGRKQRIIKNVAYHDDQEQHKNAIADTDSLIAALESVLQKEVTNKDTA